MQNFANAKTEGLAQSAFLFSERKSANTELFCYRFNFTNFNQFFMKTNVKFLRALLLMLPLMLIPMALFAQTVRVTGKVVDVSNNEALIGVNVVQAGTTNGTITDLDGNYSIEVPSNSSLQFSYIGYVSQTIAVNGKSSIDCYLSSDDQEIEQVVVVGYGTQRKEAVTGSVASVKGDVMREMPGSNITQSLQGRIAGVDLQQSSSKPGATMQIRIRGTRSLNASNDPLVVLDGVPFAGNLGDIDPNSIKSIDILKDASATAIYGSRGANGVILVTTTRGSIEQDAVITYSGYYGIKTVFSKYPMMSASQLRELREYTGRYANSEDEEAGIAAGTNTDWQDLMYDNGMVTSHDLSVTGGTKSAAYNVGLGYYKEEAVLPLQDYTRFSLRAGLDQKIGKYLKVGLTSNNNYTINNGNSIGVVLDYSPMVSPYLEDGTLRRTFDQNTTDSKIWMRTRETLEAVKDNGDWEDKAQTYGTFNSLYAELSIPYVEGLKYRVNAGLNMRYTQNGSYTGVGVFASDPNNASSGSLGKSLDLNWAVENLLTYNRLFAEKHSVNVVGLLSFERDQYHSTSISASGIASKKFLYYNLARITDDGATTVTPNGQGYSESGLKSAMARLMYSYDDRYMLTVAVRNDKSSRLAPSKNSHTYPAVSVGWNLGKEGFMSDIAWLESLKLRIGYGQTSNQAVSPFKTLGTLATRPYNFGNDVYSTGYSVQELANDQLGWEYSETMNYGVDFGFLKNRITGSFEYYVQKTNDVLLSVSLPATSGVTSYMANIGKTENKGWELNLNGTILNDFNGVTWEAGINMYSNKNKLVALASGADRDEGNFWFVGHPINSIFDYENIGLWQPEDYYYKPEGYDQSYGEILEPGGDAGMIRVKYTGEYDANGMPVRQIGPEDRQIMDIDPKLQGGFNTRVEYKNFDLNIIGAFQVGGKLICTLYAGRGYLNMLSGRRGNVDVDYFHAERDADGKLVKDANGNYTIYNRNADYPDPKTKTSGDNPQYASTLGFFDASYCKIRTITLGYNFKNNHIKWMDEAGIKKIRVYATVQNPFVIASKFHKETGLDPETNSRGNENVATGNASYRASSVLTIGTNTPSTRTFLFGLNVTF